MWRKGKRNGRVVLPIVCCKCSGSSVGLGRALRGGCKCRPKKLEKVKKMKKSYEKCCEQEFGFGTIKLQTNMCWLFFLPYGIQKKRKALFCYFGRFESLA